MDPKEEILLIFAGTLREAGRQVRKDYVDEALEEKRYGDAAFATVAQTILDRVLAEAKNRLEEE